MRVEVLYALPDAQSLVDVEFSPGLTAGEAVARSRIRERYPSIPANPVLGRHGERIDATTPVAAGDRIEICRPLVADPRAMRFEKVSAGQVMGRGADSDGTSS